MTDKRRRFQESLGEGSSLAAACREVGIGRSTGHIWKNGTLVRRKDGTVKIVPPLEPLAVRVISPRFLSEKERVQIADLASCGMVRPKSVACWAARRPRSVESSGGTFIPPRFARRLDGSRLLVWPVLRYVGGPGG